MDPSPFAIRLEVVRKMLGKKVFFFISFQYVHMNECTVSFHLFTINIPTQMSRKFQNLKVSKKLLNPRKNTNHEEALGSLAKGWLK